MNVRKTVFAQLMSFFPDYEFNKCVTKYNGNYKVRSFTCREHFYVRVLPNSPTGKVSGISKPV